MRDMLIVSFPGCRMDPQGLVSHAAAALSLSSPGTRRSASPGTPPTPSDGLALSSAGSGKRPRAVVMDNLSPAQVPASEAAHEQYRLAKRPRVSEREDATMFTPCAPYSGG